MTVTVSIRKRSSDFHVAKYLMDAASSKSSDQSFNHQKRLYVYRDCFFWKAM